MGRMVSVMLPDDDAVKLEEYCLSRRISKSDAIRLAIRMLIESKTKESKVYTGKVIVKGRRIEAVSIMPDKIVVTGEELTISQG
ncbi:MAG TPA: ribbon-helix-helix protein, CopG family [Desulfurococcales archaeon]|nr:ribbon-helix-helix protein, CopG family [Desulfurococcales archaeon]